MGGALGISVCCDFQVSVSIERSTFVIVCFAQRRESWLGEDDNHKIVITSNVRKKGNWKFYGSSTQPLHLSKHSLLLFLPCCVVKDHRCERHIFLFFLRAFVAALIPGFLVLSVLAKKAAARCDTRWRRAAAPVYWFQMRFLQRAFKKNKKKKQSTACSKKKKKAVLPSGVL